VALPDSIYYRLATTYLEDKGSVSTRSLIYNGVEHVGYFRGIKGTAYLETDQMVSASVKYDQLWYKLPMLYDLLTDQVIIKHFDGLYNVALINDKIDQFFFNGRSFRNFRLDPFDEKSISGYHEELYSGNAISVFVKRKKILKEQSTAHGMEREFISINRFYLLIDSVFHPVKSKSDLLALMGDKKKAIASYIRKNKLKFSNGRELSILMASKKYDEIP
jgi:hypothetical protein